ncbi:MAG: FG-GAP repeat protein [Bacteroidetes bacterium]|nr:FG-GAP repeat protein [Bacteroidota bacterium]
MLKIIALLVALTISMATYSQIGTIQFIQKISATSGNFTGDIASGGRFGTGITSLGDLDGDGIIDLAVGQELNSDGGLNHGAIWILFMNMDGTVKSHQKISSTDGGFSGVLDINDWFGSDVDTIGDLDGNGVVDLAVGARMDDDGGLERGAVWILFMKNDGTVLKEQKISATQGNFTGVLSYDSWFAKDLCAIGDLNQDGVNDIAVAAPHDDDFGNNRGAVWILFLDSNGTVKSHQKISAKDGNFNGLLKDDDSFGSGVSCLGDMNGDGISDLAVGAEGDDDGGIDQGATWILFMDTDGTVKSHNKISDTQGNFSGVVDLWDYTRLGDAYQYDLDGNGVNDMMIMSPYKNDSGYDLGAIYTLLLDSNSDVIAYQEIGSTRGKMPDSLENFDYFGTGGSVIGDLNKDGAPDLAIVAAGDDDGGPEVGAVYILFLSLCPINSDFNVSDTSICPGDTISFTSTSINTSQFTWLEDGVMFDSVPNPSRVFSTPGTYTISLVADSSSCGCDTSSQIIIVNPNPPKPTITRNGNTLVSSPGPSHHWYMGNTILFFETNQSYSPTKDSVYSVVVTDNNACATFSDPFDFKLSGINEINHDIDFIIYPNPNDGSFFITFSKHQVNTKITVSDILGRTLQEKFITGDKAMVNVSSDRTGIFFLSVISDHSMSVVKIAVK